MYWRWVIHKWIPNKQESLAEITVAPDFYRKDYEITQIVTWLLYAGRLLWFYMTEQQSQLWKNCQTPSIKLCKVLPIGSTCSYWLPSMSQLTILQPQTHKLLAWSTRRPRHTARHCSPRKYSTPIETQRATIQWPPPKWKLLGLKYSKWNYCTKESTVTSTHPVSTSNETILTVTARIQWIPSLRTLSSWAHRLAHLIIVGN